MDGALIVAVSSAHRGPITPHGRSKIVWGFESRFVAGVAM